MFNTLEIVILAILALLAVALIGVFVLVMTEWSLTTNILVLVPAIIVALIFVITNVIHNEK